MSLSSANQVPEFYFSEFRVQVLQNIAFFNLSSDFVKNKL